MRKLLIAFIAMLLPLCVNAQLFNGLSNPQKTEADIRSDDIASDGTRTIACSSRVTYLKTKFFGKQSTEHNVAMHMSGSQKPDCIPNILLWIHVWSFNGPLKIKEDSPSLFKFGDNSTMKIPICIGGEDMIGDKSFIYVNEFSKSITKYDVYCAIEVTPQFIESIGKGFKKLRLEVNDDIYDVEPKKDNISEFLIEEYKLLIDAFKKDRKFDEGF